MVPGRWHRLRFKYDDIDPPTDHLRFASLDRTPNPPNPPLPTDPTVTHTGIRRKADNDSILENTKLSSHAGGKEEGLVRETETDEAASSLILAGIIRGRTNGEMLTIPNERFTGSDFRSCESIDYRKEFQKRSCVDLHKIRYLYSLEPPWPVHITCMMHTTMQSRTTHRCRPFRCPQLMRPTPTLSRDQRPVSCLVSPARVRTRVADGDWRDTT
ncbi:hypothetical protein JB92DRAFT_692232 [Gautieria morchelliformis]|nr:hypothetical protein JB92DRAFT_692232 [Gautieria morchelliformis]